MLPLEIVEPHRHQFRRERARYRQQANALLSLVGLDNFGEKYPWQLSGGMQQRASLCRSLIHEPALLMLDEPFGALDAFTREELWDVLQDLWMRRRFTTILVTHDLREAVYLADTVHVMSSRPGRIIATHDVPLERPRRPRTAYEARFMDIVAGIREQIRGERDEQPPPALQQDHA
jgi:NitT/TauT family transport system ATP-binding protein